MEEKYQPDSQYKQEIKTTLYKLLEPNPNITEEKVDEFLLMAEETYKHHAEIRESTKGSYESLQKIDSDLKKMGENYRQIIETAVKTNKLLKEANVSLKRFRKIKKGRDKALDDLLNIVLKKIPTEGEA